MRLLNWKTFKEVFFSKEWRISVDELWIYSLWLSVADIIIDIIIWFGIWEISWWYNNLWVISISRDLGVWLFSLLWIGLIFLLIYMNIMVLIKRAHDLWKGGEWVAFLLIPLYNLYIWFMLSFHPWEKFNNVYWLYEEKKTSRTWILIFVVELLLFLSWNMFWDYISRYYEDQPLKEFNEWVSEHEEVDRLLSNDITYMKAQKLMKKIADDKLGCDCFWEDATEKPDRNLDATFWREVYSEFEEKILESINSKENSSD